MEFPLVVWLTAVDIWSPSPDMDLLLLTRTFRTSGFAALCWWSCLAATLTPLDLSCDHQPLANGHHRFLLRGMSRPAPDCSSSWEDQHGIVLVRGAQFDPDWVQAVTNDSVTFKKCVKVTTYKRECQDLLMVQCNASCSLQTSTNQSPVNVSMPCSSESFCMETWIWFTVTGVLVAVVLIASIVFIAVRKRLLVRKQQHTVREVEMQEVEQLHKPAGH